jgi:hypothetical protein
MFYKDASCAFSPTRPSRQIEAEHGCVFHAPRGRLHTSTCLNVVCGQNSGRPNLRYPPAVSPHEQFVDCRAGAPIPRHRYLPAPTATLINGSAGFQASWHLRMSRPRRSRVVRINIVQSAAGRDNVSNIRTKRKPPRGRNPDPPKTSAFHWRSKAKLISYSAPAHLLANYIHTNPYAASVTETSADSIADIGSPEFSGRVAAHRLECGPAHLPPVPASAASYTALPGRQHACKRKVRNSAPQVDREPIPRFRPHNPVRSRRRSIGHRTQISQPVAGNTCAPKRCGVLFLDGRLETYKS